jgi:hypothetical protein
MHFAFIFPLLYTVRDFFELNVPLIGDFFAEVFQRIINFLPL